MKNGYISLCVNIDHVATLRQARFSSYPSVVEAAQIAQNAGADGITVHLREDRRHIQDDDIPALKNIIKGKFTLEMAISEEILDIAKRNKPDLLTIVPEKREELTTEGGLDIIGQFEKTKAFLEEVNKASLKASLFIDPNLETIKAAKDAGAERIELHTGEYANCKLNSEEMKYQLSQLSKAAKYAKSLGFLVNAGHGLNTSNVKAISQLHSLEELHIGHSIISRAVLIGLNEAVKEMKHLISG
ncbi:MAG: pyridoxine 5'-phosphate synthase [Candidatus Caenarcaniphilales bacterium]|nr:pyridoxine 5'-phosphate synthase [Candidatus Caenarcaniphilales bacterium]